MSKLYNFDKIMKLIHNNKEVINNIIYFKAYSILLQIQYFIGKVE